MIVLGIESSCDETSVAVVQNGSNILSLETATSTDIHQKHGGVFPELACRRHVDVILQVLDCAMNQAALRPKDLDLIAVAKGPGLVGALLIGLQAAKGLSIAWEKPLVGINHVEAHLYASMMKTPPPLPALGFVLSGGHTVMLKINAIGKYEKLGTTLDDAIGEAFDKSALLLGLSYPGGEALEQLAQKGDSSKKSFSLPRIKNQPMNFSFSGLKTAVLHAVQEAIPKEYPDIAAAFQETAFHSLAQKAFLAIKKDPEISSIVFGGGVANNRRLRLFFSERFPHTPLFWPPEGLASDNAAMIAGLAYHQFLESGYDSSPLKIEATPKIPFWRASPCTKG